MKNLLSQKWILKLYSKNNENDPATNPRPRSVITSIPYMVQKDVLVRSIGELIGARKIPQINDVRDESTTDIRIVLEMKQTADHDVVMAYLFKNTNLQNNFNVNLTCLVPSSEDDPDRCKPARLDLRQVLLHFIRFRYKVVVRRLEHELRLLKERIHILEGFKKIFNADFIVLSPSFY